jgi:16S rRNA (uracil1498-N3)-methyltransferase
MRINPVTNWQDYCRRAELPGEKIFAHSGETGRSIGPLLPATPAGRVVAVGPEGGFTDEEAAMARESRWRIVSLGPRILRVETAAILLAALALEPELPCGIRSQERGDQA